LAALLALTRKAAGMAGWLRKGEITVRRMRGRSYSAAASTSDVLKYLQLS
jgi:hypothetical protein